MKTIIYPSGKEVKVLSWKELREWQESLFINGIVKSKKSKEK